MFDAGVDFPMRFSILVANFGPKLGQHFGPNILPKFWPKFWPRFGPKFWAAAVGARGKKRRFLLLTNAAPRIAENLQ